MISVSQNKPLTVSSKAKASIPKITTQNPVVDIKLLFAAECDDLTGLESSVEFGQMSALSA